MALDPGPPRARPIPARVAVEVAAAWEAAQGAEPCGYLLGRVGGGGRLEVVRAVAGRNRHPSPRSGFLLHAQDLLTTQRRARRCGLRVVGTWHGHLHGAAVAGRADRAALLAPAAPRLMLIAGRSRRGGAALRAYEVRAGRICRARIAVPRAGRP